MHLIRQPIGNVGVLPTTQPLLKFNDPDYLAVMCHEIGTPLSAIIGLSHILANTECSPKRKKECAEMMRDSSTMLMELMRNMLDSAKLNAGQTKIEKIKFDLVKVVQEAINIIALKATDKGLDINVHIADGFPAQCIGDPTRIRQILLNLLSNAVKFTEKGNVALYVDHIIAADGTPQVSITVTDTGIGIEPDSLKTIFNKYVQADASINRKYGGTGLGLSISQELVHLMGGNITIKSRPGTGSRFVVTLPLQNMPAMLALALESA